MISERTKKMPPFIVMDVLEKAQEMERAGIDIIHLEVGEPDFDTPSCIKKAIVKALDNGDTHYTHSLGLFELRHEICKYYKLRYKVLIEPDQIIITSGTSPAMLLLFGALIHKGDQIIISDPHYACYPNFINFLEGVPVTVPVHEESGFQLLPDAIKQKINSKTKAILINSPSNPTGNLLSFACMKGISEFAKSDAPFIISDEIYHGLVYEGVEHCILEFTDNAFVLNGFSKLYAMTGLRLGYVIAPKSFIRPMQKLQQNFFISANSIVQHAGIAALSSAGADIEYMKETYNKRRQYMIGRLKSMGFNFTVEPTGAFYIFANAKHISNDSYKLAFDILKNAHVGVTPGIDFGKNGEGYLRFSYANSLENIAKGMARIEKYFSQL